jgi:hypothetical protein
MGLLQAVLLFVRGFLAGRAALMAENPALRHDHRRVVHFNATTSPAARLFATAGQGGRQGRWFWPG